MSDAFLFLNPNLTSDEILRLVKERSKKRLEMLDKIAANAKELPREIRLEYIARCVPLLFRF